MLFARSSPQTLLRSSLARVCLGLFAAAWLLASSATAAINEVPPLPPSAEDVAASFLTRRATLWLGRTQVLPVRLAAAPANGSASPQRPWTFPVAVADPTVVEIMRPAQVLPGETLGYLRLRALRPGHTRLSLLPAGASGDTAVAPAGGTAPTSTLEIDVRADPVARLLPTARPQIVGPAAGAALWGKIAVGVEVFDEALGDPPAATTVAAAPLRVQVRLPDGRTLSPLAATGPEQGPVRRFTFEFDADSLPPGPLRLVAVASRAGESDLLEESEPVVAQVVRPADDALIAGGPCAMPGALGDAPESLAPLRPHRFGTRQPKAAPRAGTWSERAVLMPSNDPAWCLPLVVPAAGRYQLMLRAQGDQAVGALPSVALYLNDAEQPVTLARLVHAGWHRLPLGAPVKLDAGPAVLTVQFKNDFAHGKEDRNLYLDRFELMRIDGSAEETGKPAGVVLINNNVAAPSPPASPSQTPVLNRNPPPSALAVALLYPRNGQDIFGTDAVIARVNANAGSGDATARPLAWADVLLDGQPLGVRLENPPPGQPLVFPLPARGLVGNGHHLAVRAAEAGANAGLTTDSPAQLVNFLPAPPPAAAPGPYERALRLLDRFGYGPEPRELTAILTQGEAAWLDARLRESADNPRENALHALAVTRYPKLDDGGQTVARALLQAMATDNPVRARFTAWVENHFSTWLNKTGPALKWQEHRAFHRLGIAPFADLLNVSAHSPAMLVYLDQEKSFANKLNENYAREIMELHTLGVHGGYAQADVTALAGLLNGWTLAEEARVPLADEEAMQINNKNESGLEKEFRFDPALNDGRPRRIFGLDFDAAPDPWDRYDRVRFALEMLVAHPATAEHVCRKLAAHYVGSPPPEALVRDLARVFLENGGDLRVVLRALAAHPLFWSAPPRLATPQDYALRLTRLLRAADPTPDGAKSPKPEQVNDFMRKSGMGLFDRATPDGYPEGDANYSDSNALLQRWRFAQNQAGALLALVPAAWRQPPVPGEGSTLPAVDPAQRIIDLAAIRLTGRLLTPGSNAAARELLGDAPKPEQVQAAIVFVALLPEANLR